MTTTPASPVYDIAPVTIEEEMKRSYLDYAMSVIVSRALPDVRDGLKPVHRRILYGMYEGGFASDKPYKKSARVVGEVIGKYHPHGDSAIYDAMVRMAQDFSMRMPLVDGQGNFGSIDGDAPAAFRYTEARLSKAADALLADIDRDTVDFKPNYDDNEQEPVVLPARMPNLLINGAGGIAVGMATNIPPHNVGETISACLAWLDNPEITVEGLMEHIPGPDFPTSGLIIGRAGIRNAYRTGNGSVMMRAKTEIEEIRKDRMAIIVTELPYQVNKARLVERIAELVSQKIVEGISELRDESDRDGVRMVIELKRDAVADIVLNQLYKHTPMQTSFSVNMVALDHGRPSVMNLKDVIGAFCRFREEVVLRRTRFDLKKCRDRAHILVGLAVATANIDEIIRLIRAAPDAPAAREALMAKAWPAEQVRPLIALIDNPDRVIDADGNYRLTEIQAKAILDLRLHRLTGLEREKIADELNGLVEQIRHFLEILGSRAAMLTVVRNELLEMQAQFATPRKTEIVDLEYESDIEDFIKREDMVVTISMTGYIKRVPIAAYRAQKRGGKGKNAMNTKDEDSVAEIMVANTHTPLLFFSTRGMAYSLKVWRLPQGTPQARGKALINLLPLQPGETIATVMRMPEDVATWAEMDVIFATSGGTVRRNKLADFSAIRANGLIAMKLEEDEKLIAVKSCFDHQDVLLAAQSGKVVRFPVEELRVFASRTSTGVRGIRLAEGDQIVSMSILDGVDATAEEREAYISLSRALRRAEGSDEAENDDEESVTVDTSILSEARFAELQSKEQFILTVTARGMGKRSSAYEYRATGRGVQGYWGLSSKAKDREVVASFAVRDDEDVLMVSDGGQMIRLRAPDIKLSGRATQGVILFRLNGTEKVVSVARLDSEAEADDSETDTPDIIDIPETA